MPVVVPQREVDLRVGQRDAREGLGDVAHLGLRGAEELAPHGRVEEQVADLDGRADRAAAGGDRPMACRRPLRVSAPAWLLGVRLRSVKRLTSAIEARASPRKPSVPTRNRSSASSDLAGGVAGHGQRQLVPAGCRSRCRRRGSAPSPPCSTETSIRVAPASTAFSSSSLTTLAGRSITSPAAILLTTLGRQLTYDGHRNPFR